MKKIFNYPLILALLTFWAISYQLDTFSNNNGYKFIFLIGFIGIYYLFKKYKYNSENKRTNKILITASIILSALLIIGRTVLKYEYLPTANLFTIKSIIFNLTFIIFLIPFIFVLLTHLISFFNNIKLDNKVNITKKFSILTFICIYLGKIPYLLAFFPGVTTIDSLNIINTFEKGILYNHHPVVFTYFFGFIYKIGKTIFHSGSLGLCFYMLIQILIISLILTYLIIYLSKKGFNKKIIYFLILYFSISPDFGYMSVTLWKDVLFGFAFIPFILSLLTLYEKDYHDKSSYIIFIISSLVILFFRNNGIYVYLLTTIIIFFLFSKQRILPITSLSLVVLFFIVTGPVYKSLNVTPGRTVESYSIPLEQVGRVYLKKGHVDKESDKYFKNLINIEGLNDKYLTWLADPMKGLTNNDILKQDQKKFIKYWFKTFLNNPVTYVESFLSSTVGYWYPDVPYISIRESSTNVAENYDITRYGIYNKSLLPTKVVNLIRKSTSKSIPLSMTIWSLGFSFFILIISFTCSLIFKLDKKLFIIYVPLIGLWLTNIIAAPVYNEYRYMYGLVLCNILLIAIPLIYKNYPRKALKK